jgi:hypothetical protein
MLIDALDRLPGRWAARTCPPSIEKRHARRALRIETAEAAYADFIGTFRRDLALRAKQHRCLPTTIGVPAQVSASLTSLSICQGKPPWARDRPPFPFFRTTRWPDLPQARVNPSRLLHSYYRVHRPARLTAAPISSTHCPRRGHASNIHRLRSTSNP